MRARFQELLVEMSEDIDFSDVDAVQYLSYELQRLESARSKKKTL